MVKEVVVDWGIPSGIATQSILYFEDGLDPNFLRQNVADAMGACGDWLSNAVSWNVGSVVRTYNTASGTLSGEESSATVLTGGGNSVGAPVADATQALVVHTTGVVLNGRFLKGRTFLPGVSATHLSGGNLAPAARTGFAGAFTANLLSGGGLVVWHRPKAGVGGQAVAVTSCATNAEFAVLRRRRNR